MYLCVCIIYSFLIILIQHSVRLWVKFFRWEEENLSFIQGLCLQIILWSFPFLHHPAFPASFISLSHSFFLLLLLERLSNYVKKPSAVPITKLRVSPRCAYMTSWQIKSTVHPQKLPGSLSSQKLLWNIKLTCCSSLGHCQTQKTHTTHENCTVKILESWGFFW